MRTYFLLGTEDNQNVFFYKIESDSEIPFSTDEEQSSLVNSILDSSGNIAEYDLCYWQLIELPINHLVVKVTNGKINLTSSF